MTGSGLGGQPRRSFFLVVVGLGDGRVGLVRTGGRDAFVLVVDTRGGTECLLEAVSAEQRGGSPLAVDVEDATGDLDVSVGGDLLQDQFHREQWREIVRTDGVHSARVQGRRRRRRQVGHQVVPNRRHLILRQQVLVLANRVVHNRLLLE